jgi:hypothetical protein
MRARGKLPSTRPGVDGHDNDDGDDDADDEHEDDGEAHAAAAPLEKALGLDQLGGALLD